MRAHLDSDRTNPEARSAPAPGYREEHPYAQIAMLGDVPEIAPLTVHSARLGEQMWVWK
jgi:hypothetical protein